MNAKSAPCRPPATASGAHRVASGAAQSAPVAPRILGIDPGTGICGFGVICGRKALDYGVITTPPHTPLPDRLEDIYNSLHEIIDANHPDVMAIEKLFFKQNVTTGISVAEARGICLLVAKQYHLPIYEYAPNQIKKAICGYGQAHKPQIQAMVKLHLGLAAIPQPDDAADALAVAIVHSLLTRTHQPTTHQL